MINSRDLNELHPTVRAKTEAMLTDCRARGLDLIVTSTYRDMASQTALYAQGRTVPGKKVTNAKAGQSFHNWRVAFDIVPMRAGKPVWGTSGSDGDLWRRIAGIGKAHGLEWGGDFKSIKDFPHFQYTGGLSLADFQSGKTLPTI